MTARRPLLLALALLGAAAPESPAPQQEETVFVDEVKKDFLEKIAKCEESKDWKTLFEHYAHGLKKYAQKVVAVPSSGAAGSQRWMSVSEHLTQRLSKLPKAAYEYYRLENDGRAGAMFARAREENDRRLLEKAVEEFFFSSYTDEALDTLGNLAFDEGRVDEAIFHWTRLLRHYPDSEIPRALTAARIAHASRLAENEAALADLRGHVAGAKLAGKVRVAGRESELADFLKGVQIPPRVVEARPLKVPFTQEVDDRYRRKVIGVRNDIKRWTYDFSADRKQADRERSREEQIMLARMGRQPAPQFGEYPLFPAHARARGRDYVLFTDGTRVVAVDPAKVKGSSATSGVFWKYPSDAPIPRHLPDSNASGYAPSNQPYIGATVDGEHAYVTMYSRAEHRPRDTTNQNNYDFFEGTTAVKCIHIPSGKLVWDTDATPLWEDYKKQDFYERNFSFSSPPLIKGDRLFLGICTSPMGEQESRVVCLDKKTGKLLWSTFLASVTGGRNAWGWSGGRLVVYQTMLAEQGGVIFAHTNLGILGALNSVSGNVLWLSPYKRSVSRRNDGMEGSYAIRPANWPVLWKDRIFLLGQDRIELLAFEKLTGKPIDFDPPRTREGPLDWKVMTHLVGIVDDWMVVGGTVSHVIRLQTLQAYSLASSNTSRTGRGVIVDDLVYLPATSNQAANQAGVLAIYDVRTWKSLDQPAWKEANEYGNLLVAGNFLVVATNKVMVYTDVETIRGDFVHRLYQSPPHADSLLEFGDTMRENDRLEEAAEAYLAYVRAAEGDPKHEARLRTVKSELHGIFLRRGEEAAGKNDLSKAAEFYGFAKGFSYDEKTHAESTRRLADTCEKLQRWKEAVEQYQELVEKARGLWHREGEGVSKLWDHARRSIDAIVAKAPEAYEAVEKRAAEALVKAKEGGSEALRDVMDRFPNSRTARDAWQGVLEALRKEGRLDRLRSLYDEFKERFKIDLDFDSTRKVLEFLEKIGDADRLRRELAAFAERFGAEKIALETEEVGVKEWVERKLQGLVARPAPLLRGKLAKIGEIETPKAVADPHALPAPAIPLRPRGIEPPALAAHHEVLARGSSVELWDLKEKRRVWACPHPGGWLGAVFTPADGGATVTALKSGSPAEKAGIQKGDLIVSVDGKAAAGESLTGILAGLAPGSSVEVVHRRADKELKAKVELAAHPEGMRPAIVGASWTRDYSLAVAWEDGVASIELSSGRVQWFFRGLRDRFHVKAFHSTEGRLYVYEGHRPDRDADVYRTPKAQNAPVPAADQHLRLICLGDFTGEVVWARAFDTDQMQQHGQMSVTFMGPYVADHVTFLQTMPRPGAMEWIFWQLGARDGGLVGPGRRSLVGQVLAWTAETEGGVFYYVSDLTSDRRERYLYSLPLDPARKDVPKLEVKLHDPKYMPAPYAMCALAANRDSVCLLAPAPQPGGDHRVLVFKAANGELAKSVSLLPDRTLAYARPASAFLDRAGTLYVYNVPRAAGPQAPAPARAYLTAFRLGAEKADDITAWDAVAPVLANNQGQHWTLAQDGGGLLVFGAARATAPGQTGGEGGVAAVYDTSAEGYLQMVHAEVAAGVDPPPVAQAWGWRGRLFVVNKQGLQIYAPE